ncbi:MAG TPA: phytanoyl-CoA dioxygenase family protein [Acidimicrobiales bacterium]|nr:phytanoyl-CoA dioxygenase family protein [Acidimicrobiales bacterium]
MQELKDSSALRADPDRLRARLRSDGYLFLPGLLDPGPLAALRSVILGTVAEHGWLAEGTDPDDAVPSDPPRFHMGKGWRRAYIAIQRIEAFHRQAFDPDAVALVTGLLEEPVLVHGQRIARLIWPVLGDEPPPTTTPAHQDFTHIQGTPDVITTWIPLGDVPASSGGLRVLTGSHRQGLRPVEASSGAGGLRSLVDEDDDRWATADYHLGDVVCFHSYTVHGSLPNTSDRLRLSVDYRYQRLSEPVAEPSTRPHNCPYVPDWPELLDGVDWVSTEWARLPEGAEVVAMTMPGEAGLDQWVQQLQGARSRLLEDAGAVS